MITGYGWIQRNDWIEFAWLTLTFGLEASQHLGRDTIALEGRDKHDGLTTHYIPNQKSSIRPMFDSILHKMRHDAAIELRTAMIIQMMR